eukprot:114078-Pelagomonas_calceolata.AAC.2
MPKGMCTYSALCANTTAESDVGCACKSALWCRYFGRMQLSVGAGTGKDASLSPLVVKEPQYFSEDGGGPSAAAAGKPPAHGPAKTEPAEKGEGSDSAQGLEKPTHSLHTIQLRGYCAMLPVI